MRKLLAIACALFLIQTASLVQAADLSFSINVGGPAVVISQPPDFLYPPELGYGVAVGVPYDMFYSSGIYYLYRGGGWYRTSSYGGGWIKMRHRELPPEFRRYKIANIRQYREREYRVYSRDRANYQGRYYRPGRAGGEEHRDMRGPGREVRQENRGQRPNEHDQRPVMRERRPNEREQRPNEHEQGNQHQNDRGGERGDHGRDR